MNVWIKQLYHFIVMILSIVTARFINPLKSRHITILMTFPEDMLPVITALYKEQYHLTVITHPKHMHLLNEFEDLRTISLTNSHLISQIKSLNKSQLIIIDNYYLMLGGYRKKKGQNIIQTWHASGALKQFGLKDHQVNLHNRKMIKQYQSVYHATDYYLISSNAMASCFMEALGATQSQMLSFGLPRLIKYFNTDMTSTKQRLKQQYGIQKKIALYVPTYREKHMNNKMIDKERFERELPEYTLINQLHPSITDVDNHITADTSTLMMMADLIISDYSSLPIEGSLLGIPTIFYVYDEAEYEKQRGLNKYYYQIPAQYKVTTEAQLIATIQKQQDTLQPLFDEWHQYSSARSLEQLLTFIKQKVK